jgi:hypothetical protein
MVFENLKNLNANLPYGHDVAKRANDASSQMISCKFASFAPFALSFCHEIGRAA